MQRNPSRTIMHTKYSKYSLLRIKLSTKKPRITLDIALKLTISYNSNLKKKKILFSNASHSHVNVRANGNSFGGKSSTIIIHPSEKSS